MSLLLLGVWLRPTQAEIDELVYQCQAWLAPEQAIQNRLCGALVLISVLCSCNLSACQQVELSGDISLDWSIDLRSGILQRKPARFANGWVAGTQAVQEGWVEKLLDAWKIKLSSQLIGVLRLVKRRSNSAASLGDLWRAVSSATSLEKHFRDLLDGQPNLERFSTRMLAEVLPTLMLKQGTDQAEIALLCSSTRSALPAKCAYLSLATNTVSQRLGQSLPADIATVEFPSPEQRPLINGAGSQMMLDIGRVREEVSSLRARLIELASDPSSWIQSHNLTTVLFVLELFAATGLRPVNSPFEAFSLFDFSRSLAYLSDKQGGRSHNDRLGVLPRGLAQRIDGFYRQHLASLLALVDRGDPSSLSFFQALSKLQEGRGDELPLFFFLEMRHGVVEWEEVSEATLVSMGGLQWPVALNLFRHILSTYCTARGLDSDIRDAILGHADRYAEPHGDFSPRTPWHDFEQARPIIEGLCERIFGDQEPTQLALPLAGTCRFSLNPRVFGERARALRRELIQEATIKATNDELEAKTTGQDIQAWSRQDWYQLGRSMLVRSDGGPHSQGWLRYQVFEGFVDELRQSKNICAKPSAKFIRLGAARPYFSKSIIGADELLIRVRHFFETIVDADVRLHDSPLTAAYLACLDLVLTHKVCSWLSLKRLLLAPQDVRIIKFDQAY
ncbi:MAG: hypothetical protein KGN37_17145, partial [Burkholderiales bacterium]|nr:hypothetical protein [Burkholderiales bacterium]